MNVTFTFLFCLAVLSASAETNTVSAVSNPPSQIIQTQTNQAPASGERAEQIRAACVQGRRLICGKILRVLPDGLVIECGYTNLMRPPLDRSWLVPGTATASREPNLIEDREPGSMCAGVVFLTDIPKSRRDKPQKPKQYDYVILQGYPAGQYTYTSLGTVERTVRRFSAGLQTAIDLSLQAETNSLVPATGVK
jgi:hypothetical protein